MKTLLEIWGKKSKNSTQQNELKDGRNSPEFENAKEEVEVALSLEEDDKRGEKKKDSAESEKGVNILEVLGKKDKRKWAKWTSPIRVGKMAHKVGEDSSDVKSVASKRRRPESISPMQNPRKYGKRARGPEGQVFLDLGQRNFETKICPKCEMMYAPGVAEDEKNHAVFCSTVTRSPASLGIRKIPEEIIVSKPQDGSGEAVVLLNSETVSSKHAQAIASRILTVKRELIDQAMGFQDYGEEDFSKRAILAQIATKEECKLLGLVVIEPIESKHRIWLLKKEMKMAGNSHQQVQKEIKRDSFLSRGPGLGVLQIWVSQENRRRGIATNLLNCARRVINYGHVYNLDQICFSQPTCDGMNFAKSFAKLPEKGVLVYSFLSSGEE